VFIVVKNLSFLIFIFLSTQFIFNSTNAESIYYAGLFSKVALKGYDSVEYFKSNTAVKGDKAFSYKWENITWRFSNEENLKTFSANPEKYLPQYGGWCAYAMADGQKVGVDPRSFDIKDGKLYLNYNKKIQNKWRKKQNSYIEKADAKWKKLSI
jgi:YHS domain-containing protein